MADDKKDDFWNSGNDDFWNTDTTKADYSGLSQDFFESEKPRRDPFWENKDQESPINYTPAGEDFKTENPYLKSHVHQDSGWVMEQHKMEKPIESGQEKKSRIHVRTIICLIFILIAILSIVTAVVCSKITREQVMKQAMKLSYKETEVSHAFLFHENNEVFLEDNAYTIVTGESFKGFPEGMKLIAVYAEVISEDYISDSYALQDIYIGFEKDGRNAYKKPAKKSIVSPYIYGCGFSSEQLLPTYGIGNGTDNAGYYFFFVPENTEKITLYMEKIIEKNDLPMIEEIFWKEMSVLPEDELLKEELAERKVQ